MKEKRALTKREMIFSIRANTFSEFVDQGRQLVREKRESATEQ